MLTNSLTTIDNGFVIQYYDASLVYEENPVTKTVTIKKFMDSQTAMITFTETAQIQNVADIRYDLSFQ